MQRSRGFTILELLVSLGLLLVMLGASYGAIERFLEARQTQDAITATQAKLRRVLEVFTQDLRSAVFGAIINEPYRSGESAVSFALLKGSSGFKVVANDPSSWPDRYSTKIIAENPGIKRGDHVLIVNKDQKAVILKVSGVRRVDTRQWRIWHRSCRNTLTYYPNTLLFAVDLYGVRHDEADKTLILNVNGREQLLAFDIQRFRVEYLSSNRLRITLSSEQALRGRRINRQYTGVVDLYNNATFDIQEVVSCKP